jgi:hypothetical protein
LQLPPTVAAFSPRAKVLLKLIGVEGRPTPRGRRVARSLGVMIPAGDLFDAPHQVGHKL